MTGIIIGMVLAMVAIAVIFFKKTLLEWAGKGIPKNNESQV